MLWTIEGNKVLGPSGRIVRECANQNEACAHKASLEASLVNRMKADTDSTTTMLQAIDAALDEACDIFDSVGSSSSPEVQQGIALVYAAESIVDDLMDAMGVYDADDDPESTESAAGYGSMKTKKAKRANPFAKYLKQKASAAGPYGDVTYADSKNKKYPVNNAARARAAWDYINKPANAAVYPLNGVTLDEVKGKIRAACKKFGITLSS